MLGHTATSTTGYRKNFFQAANDDNPPLNINADGGLYVHYEQFSQELEDRLAGGWAAGL